MTDSLEGSHMDAAVAALAGAAIGANDTKATPSVAAVVQELPIARPTRPQMIAVAG